jgi:hypothetical protein
MIRLPYKSVVRKRSKACGLCLVAEPSRVACGLISPARKVKNRKSSHTPSYCEDGGKEAMPNFELTTLHNEIKTKRVSNSNINYCILPLPL